MSAQRWRARKNLSAAFASVQALPEHRSGGLWAAHGRYGFPIYIEGPGAAKNQPVEVEVRGLVRDGVIAAIVS